MTDTQQVTEFNLEAWRTNLAVTLRKLVVDFSFDVDAADTLAEVKRLFNAVPPAVRPDVADVMNRLASVAYAHPKLFNPKLTPHAYKMQDVAISMCSVILQIMYNGERK